AAGIGLAKVRSRTDHDVAGHFRMYIAQQRHHTRVIELEGALLALRPGSQIMAQFLVAANRRPEHVVLDRVAVLEIHRRADLNDHDVRLEEQTFLVYQNRFGGSGERFTLDGIHINHRLTRDARYFARDAAGHG